MGLVLVVALGVVSLLYLIFTIGLETAALLEVRRYARELLHYKKLAEEAEQSRYTELRGYLEAEFKRLAEAEKEEIRALEAPPGGNPGKAREHPGRLHRRAGRPAPKAPSGGGEERTRKRRHPIPGPDA